MFLQFAVKTVSDDAQFIKNVPRFGEINEFRNRKSVIKPQIRGKTVLHAIVYRQTNVHATRQIGAKTFRPAQEVFMHKTQIQSNPEATNIARRQAARNVGIIDFCPRFEAHFFTGRQIHLVSNERGITFFDVGFNINKFINTERGQLPKCLVHVFLFIQLAGVDFYRITEGLRFDTEFAIVGKKDFSVHDGIFGNRLANPCVKIWVNDDLRSRKFQVRGFG